jgi:hypothetical protein
MERGTCPTNFSVYEFLRWQPEPEPFPTNLLRHGVACILLAFRHLSRLSTFLCVQPWFGVSVELRFVIALLTLTPLLVEGNPLFRFFRIRHLPEQEWFKVIGKKV